MKDKNKWYGILWSILLFGFPIAGTALYIEGLHNLSSIVFGIDVYLLVGWLLIVDYALRNIVKEANEARGRAKSTRPED